MSKKICFLFRICVVLASIQRVRKTNFVPISWLVILNYFLLYRFRYLSVCLIVFYFSNNLHFFRSALWFFWCPVLAPQSILIEDIPCICIFEHYFPYSGTCFARSLRSDSSLLVQSLLPRSFSISTIKRPEVHYLLNDRYVKSPSNSNLQRTGYLLGLTQTIDFFKILDCLEFFCHLVDLLQ